MQIYWIDQDIVACIKPARVLSTDEPGGLPQLLRDELKDPGADIRTVHRLDRVVSGLMVLARNPAAASELSRQIRTGEFEKEYLAVIHGRPTDTEGTLTDLLGRDKARKMTFVAEECGKGIQEASLSYKCLGFADGMSLVAVRLHTGRTHQIRIQFASRGLPLVGERKYSVLDDPCEIALYSQRISFTHPVSGQRITLSSIPDPAYPWNCFQEEVQKMR